MRRWFKSIRHVAIVDLNLPDLAINDFDISAFRYRRGILGMIWSLRGVSF